MKIKSSDSIAELEQWMKTPKQIHIPVKDHYQKIEDSDEDCIRPCGSCKHRNIDSNKVPCLFCSSFMVIYSGEDKCLNF